MSFVPFMRSATGRTLRIIAGIALIAVGISIGGTGGVIIAGAGIVPLAAGVFNFCLAVHSAGSTSWAASTRGADPGWPATEGPPASTQATVRS